MPESSTAVQFLTVDYVFAGILLLSCLYGLFRGLIRELLSLVHWALALWAAYMFGPQAAEMIGTRIDLGSLRLAAGYLAVFIGVLIFGGIIGFLIVKSLSATGLAATDRVLGLVFGALRGLAVGVLLVLLGQYTLLKDEPWWRDSMTVQQLTPLAEKARVLMPAEWTLPESPPSGVPESLPPAIVPPEGAGEALPELPELPEQDT